jgi:hypothetical protein
MRTRTAALLTTTASLTAMAVTTTATAAPADEGTESQGVGLCISVVAQDATGIGGTNLGAVVSRIATTEPPGAVAYEIDLVRAASCEKPA